MKMIEVRSVMNKGKVIIASIKVTRYLKGIFLYLSGLFPVIVAEQHLRWLSFSIGDMQFFFLGANYFAVVAVILLKKYVDSRRDLLGEEPRFHPVFKLPVIKNALFKHQLFAMASFSISMEMFLTLKGNFPERNLLYAGLFSFVLWGLLQLVYRSLALYIISLAVIDEKLPEVYRKRKE